VPRFQSTDVDVARAAIAARLRELRKESGLTASQLAESAGWNKSKSSRLETGTTPPSDDDIRIWCRVCGADDREVNDLIAQTRRADEVYVEWRRMQQTGMRRMQETRMLVYERTRHFHVYSSNIIPGLLETFAYAEALLSTVADFHGVPNDASEAAKARLARARILKEAGRQFAFLVEEHVLYHPFGDSEVMSAQLGQLLADMVLPAVSIGIIPRGTQRARAVWPIESFMVLDGEVASVELLTAKVTIRAPGQVAQYGNAFARLADMAVYGAGARRLIRQALESFE
jgi:transcriptional regulator with XRE-family HTH domain